MLAERTLLDCGFDISDVLLAKTLLNLVEEDDERVQLSICLLSYAARQGDVCVSLQSTSPRDGIDFSNLEKINLTQLGSAVSSSKLFGDGSAIRPLVLDQNGYGYFNRYWVAQERLIQRILTASIAPTSGGLGPVENAMELAKTSGFLVVTGGPGTGKTTLVSRVLAELITEQTNPSIAVCTPTGKAAIRLRTSLLQAKQSGILDSYSNEVISKIPEEVSTIHKLLCPLGRMGGFRFNRETRLPIDILVVDEASMIDLQLMSSLFDAVPRHAKIILIGDKHQLSSIQPGMVLGDICYGETVSNGTNSHVAKCIVTLDKSYRFSEKSEIGMLASAVNSGNVDDAISILDTPANREISFTDLRSPGAKEALLTLAQTVYQSFGRENEPELKLRDFNNVRVLCATNSGNFGVRTINREISERLQAVSTVDNSASLDRTLDKTLDRTLDRTRDRSLDTVFETENMGTLRENQPIMITENDYTVDLFNGDVGIVCRKEEGGSHVAFSTEEGGVRFVSASMVSAYQDAYAISVHKSQGSEFSHTIVVLPDVVSPVLSRELLYTAITRAKEKLTIFATKDVIAHCILHPVVRTSGLRERLWKN